MSISSERQEPGIAAPVERRARRRRRARDRLSFGEFLVFLAPLLIFLILLYGMLIWTFYVSVADWRGVAPNYTFAGFKWYDMMFDLARFRQDVVNNLKWLVIGVIPTVVVALFIAYILEIGSIRGVENYVRTLILYPVAMSFIVSGTIWSWMYQPDRGVFNTILRSIGLEQFTGRFITNPDTATYWLITIFIWQYLGFSVIILQSSFRTTELQEMIESAIVDGASRLRILLQIIVPNIRGGILILVSLLLISSLKVFDIVYVVTFGGPGFATDVLAFYMVVATFQQHLVSLGAGIGVIIFLLAFIIVIPYTIYAFRKWFE
ncbi:MAG TPA: sugar ABC transporter permease [Aggregatilineales bacterium]|nr:sugar ABC transporter permease [Aggregatilineales bacterium]HPV07899.1 sugar ABC transporter permease [Aggregatilineales bacterium]HQA66790.1 sugar ABC transporter permease [Aggregatilineales bacterium]